MEQIAQCDNILMYEGNGYNEAPYVEPAHEVDHTAIAALLDHCKFSCPQPELILSEEVCLASSLSSCCLYHWSDPVGHLRDLPKSLALLQCAHLQAASM